MLDKRTELVAKKVSQFLRETNRYDKTIVFCEDIDHAERNYAINTALEIARVHQRPRRIV